MDFLARLFDTSDFPARWQCGNWTAGHGWLHILSDLGVWSAYVAIPCVLGYFVIRKKDIPFRTIFLLFGAFILACGTTHLMEALLFWWPAYRLAGLLKLFTAVVSWGTVLALVPVTPKALAMRSPEELGREIAARKEAENDLLRANTELEMRVQERTAELEQANASLRESQRREKERADELEAILRATPTPIWIAHDPQCHRITGNPASFTLLGLPEGANVSATSPDHDPNKRGFREYRGSTPVPPNELPVQRAAGGEFVEGAEVKFVFDDGRVRYIYGNAVPLRNPDGGVRGCVAAFADVTPLKEAEESLRQATDQLRIVTDSMAALVTRCSHDLKYLWVSKPYAGWIKRPANEIIGRPIIDTIGPEAFGRLLPHFQEVLSGQVVRYEEKIDYQTIGPRWISAVYTPTLNAEDVPDGWVAVVNDLTERRQLEEALRGSEERHRRITDLIPFGAWTTDIHGNPTYLSPLFLGMVGQTLEEHRRAWPDTIHPEDAPATVEKWRDFVATGGEWHHEFRMRGREGQYRTILARGFPVRDAGGRVTEFVGINYDITERKRREETLRVSEQRWHTMAEALPNLVWTDLPDGQCDWLSTQWGKYTGIPENELLGLRWLDMVIHPDDRERTLACWQAACADKADYDLEYRIRRYDGEYHWFKTRGVPVRDDEGKIVYWFGTCTDIEDGKRLEAALRETDRKKDEFLATLAHELRNPLAPIRNAVQILYMKGPAEAALQTSRDIIDRQVRSLARLVDDLLDVSRISRGKINLQKQRSELSPILTNAVEASRPLIEAHKHEFTLTLPPAPVYVDADTTRLAQALSNLLNNAAKYTEPGGHIWLTSERQGSDVVVSVKDNGTGIPADKLPTLFQMFSQVEGSLSHSQGGLGIGLHLVKRLVEMHGGSVTARSEGAGKGSEFVVRLPVIVEASGLSAPQKEDEPTAPKSSLRILIVDDNRDAAHSLGMMLRLMGNDIRTAYDGDEAVTAADEFRPDVVLLDIGLPKLNGYEVCRRIREQPWSKGMVLIAVTGWGQEEDRRLSHEAGFDKHMVKPVEPKVLMNMLGELDGVKAS